LLFNVVFVCERLEFCDLLIERLEISDMHLPSDLITLFVKSLL